MKLIIIDHARERMRERGAEEDEVAETISRGSVLEASSGRKAREMVFLFGRQWQGKFYEQKKVRVVYTEDDDEFTVITVYTYFGKWEER